MPFKGIVLNIPHASTAFPSGKSGWDDGIDSEILRWTDWYTDWLFASASRLDRRIVPVQFPFSRFFCDAERLVDDPLMTVGQGLVYERFNGLNRGISTADRIFAERCHSEHRERLRRAITGENTLLIDCHSFPLDLSDVDVCIGVNDDWSRPGDAILERILLYFKKSGFKAKVNDPYSNSIIPDCGFPYTSMMLEVNKKTYLASDRQMDYGRAYALRNCLEGFLISMLTSAGHFPF